MQNVFSLNILMALGIQEAHNQLCCTWRRSFKKALVTKLNFSIAFHPQFDNQTKRIIRTLEDMLKACVYLTSREVGYVTSSSSFFFFLMGYITYVQQNSLIIIVFKQASRWHRTRLYTKESIDCRYIGERYWKDKFWV